MHCIISSKRRQRLEPWSKEAGREVDRFEERILNPLNLGGGYRARGRCKHRDIMSLFLVTLHFEEDVNKKM